MKRLTTFLCAVGLGTACATKTTEDTDAATPATTTDIVLFWSAGRWTNQRFFVGIDHTVPATTK